MPDTPTLQQRWSRMTLGADLAFGLVDHARTGTLDALAREIHRMSRDGLEDAALALAVVLAATPDADWAAARQP